MIRFVLAMLIAKFIISCAVDETETSGTLTFNPDQDIEIPEWLSVKDVDHNKDGIINIIKGLARFKEAFGEYADRDIYACVAFVRTNDKTLAYAEKRGLFIIRATPPDVELLNGKKFKPVKFA